MESNWPYTTIDHGIRKYAAISCEAYILADMVYHLQNNKAAKIQGWFYGSREHLADEIGVSKRTIVRLIGELVDKGFIERDETTSYLRTTKEWDEMFVARGETKWRGSRAKVARDPHATLSPNNNNIYSLLLITNNNELFPDFKKSESELNSFLKEKFLAKYLKENGTEAYFTAKEAGKFKGIISKIVFKMKEKSGKEFFEPDEIKKAIEFFINASWDINDQFVRNNFSLTTIDSKFNDIYVKIKNASNGQQSSYQNGRPMATGFKFNAPDPRKQC